MTDDEIERLRALATSWLTDNSGRIVATRERAINEEILAFGVLDLITERRLLRDRIARIEQWTLEYGAALKPSRADTYGDGMRDAKEQVARICTDRVHARTSR